MTPRCNKSVKRRLPEQHKFAWSGLMGELEASRSLVTARTVNSLEVFCYKSERRNKSVTSRILF